MGDDCLIHSTALIGYESQLGEQVEVGPGTVIGSEGYGFAQDAAGKSHRIPQTGKVVLEDRVRIGAHNCIDRAAFGADHSLRDSRAAFQPQRKADRDDS